MVVIDERGQHELFIFLCSEIELQYCEWKPKIQENRNIEEKHIKRKDKSEFDSFLSKSDQSDVLELLFEPSVGKNAKAAFETTFYYKL